MCVVGEYNIIACDIPHLVTHFDIVVRPLQQTVPVVFSSPLLKTTNNELSGGVRSPSLSKMLEAHRSTKLFPNAVHALQQAVRIALHFIGAAMNVRTV